MPHIVRVHLARFLVAATVLIALLVGPISYGSPNPLPLSEATGSLLLRASRWVIGALVVRELNTFLSEWADNRWSLGSDEAPWDWKNEVAVVTGGSGGIGALVVKKLVSHGVRVAVLDVEPLSSVFHQSKAPWPIICNNFGLANVFYRREGTHLPISV